MENSKCIVCEAPCRILWPANRGPALDLIGSSDWISIHRCASCQAMWVVVPHEPHSMFHYAVLWKWTKGDWDFVSSLDRGTTLHQWHQSAICKVGPTLTGIEQDEIQRHLARSSGLEPYGNHRLVISDDPDSIIERALAIK